jgi:hypothetical protein
MARPPRIAPSSRVKDRICPATGRARYRFLVQRLGSHSRANRFPPLRHTNAIATGSPLPRTGAGLRAIRREGCKQAAVCGANGTG